MYKALRFDGLYDLKDFLNENEIKPTEIIGIYRTPISPNAGLYDLLYYIKEKEADNECAEWIDDKCSACGKGTEDLIASPEWYRNENPEYCPFCGIKIQHYKGENK